MSFEALDLALALHSAPRQVEALRARPLPADVHQVLRIALAQPAALEQASRATGQSAAVLIEAARFFIEQLLLARECERDAWRVLGLRPGASKARLREHHQLLVRLVHPDRSDEWAEVYADRVAKAWRRLRDRGSETPEDDAGDDAAELTTPVRSDDADAWTGAVCAPASRTSEPSWPPLPTHARPAQAVSRWQGPALALTVAGAVVAAVWLGFGGDRVDGDATEVAATAPEVPAAVAIRPVVESAAIAAPEWTPPPTPAAPEDTIETPHVAPTLEPIAPARPAPPRAAPPVARHPVATRPPAPPTATTPAIVAAVAVAPAEAAAPPPTRVAIEPPRLPSDAETLALLDRYTDTYARGDLDGLLALFARPVHADAHRVASIAADYTRLFGATREREIRLHSLHWRSRGDRVSGEARFEARYQRNGRSRPETEQGRIAFELIHDAGQSRLLRLESRRDGGS